MARGRPTIFSDEYCQQIINLMSQGRSLDGCAVLIGVHPDTLYEWQRRHPEFSEAVRAGRAAATTFWETRLLAVGNGEAGNAQLIQWALRNRSRSASGWDHAHRKIEISTSDENVVAMQGRSIELNSLSSDQRAILRTTLLSIKDENS
jgi:hypothetical protein